MFSSDSRYRSSPLITTVNRAGQPISAAELRLPPPAPGTFAHLIQESERVDSLAHKYFRNPLRWWRIADANPTFVTPEEMLGTSPWATERIALTPPGAAAPWGRTLAAAGALPGVRKVIRASSYRLLVTPQTVLGQVIEVVTELVDETVLVTYNALVVDPAAVAAVFTAAGFTVTGREAVTRVGQPIVIPPERG
jgi:hypothetical protein